MTVVALLGGDVDKADAQITYAAGLAKHMKTDLRGLMALPDPRNAYMYIGGPEAIGVGTISEERVAKAQQDAIDLFSERFGTVTKAAGSWLHAEFEARQGAPHYHAASAAMLADAIVLPHRVAYSSHLLNPHFEYLMMQARLPLVTASSDGTADGPVLIAWDGSPQAARAVRLHQEVIRAYEHAVILHNPDKVRECWTVSPHNSVDALAKWLHDERVDTKVETVSGAVSEAIEKAASAHKAGLVVMGAYGHSRIGELVFGGTSRALLNADSGPAIALAH